MLHQTSQHPVKIGTIGMEHQVRLHGDLQPSPLWPDIAENRANFLLDIERGRSARRGCGSVLEAYGRRALALLCGRGGGPVAAGEAEQGTGAGQPV